MKLIDLKKHLSSLDDIAFSVHGKEIPKHFHITEMGVLSKKYIDCGGTYREDDYISFQFWAGDDEDHLLKAEKILSIIEKCEQLLDRQDLDLLNIEFEYQTDTIGRYGAEIIQGGLNLTPKHTTCLAPELCGPTTARSNEDSCCTPGSGCC